jgi:hypothetical protein
MRLIVAVSVSLLGLAAHAQPNTLDPATQARLRMDGFAGGTGARIPPEANGGATVGEGQPNRHRVTKPVDLNPAPPEAAQAQPSSDTQQKVESQNLESASINADALDPATKARLRLEGFAGGTGAQLPPEANGGAAVGEGQPNLR